MTFLHNNIECYSLWINEYEYEYTFETNGDLKNCYE